MMHSWAHNNLGRLPHEQATDFIDRCIDYFAEHLEGFEQERSIFNFPFNSSTPELEAYALGKVRALRTGGTWAAMPFPTSETKVLSCVLYPRPGNGDEWLETTTNDFLRCWTNMAQINVNQISFFDFRLCQPHPLTA